jgi:hemoglobin
VQPDDTPPRPDSVYAAIGGAPAFERLVAAFYTEVEADPVLRAIYPEEDLVAAQERLRLFLIQYWGGPETYSDQRGHPRLRMRHAPFAINAAARDAWLTAMRKALDTLDLPPNYDKVMWDYFSNAADALRNLPG